MANGYIHTECASDLDQRCLKTCRLAVAAFPEGSHRIYLLLAPKPHFGGPFNAKPIIERVLHKSHVNGAHSLTAALDQLRVVASSTSNDPGPRSRQHQQIGQWSYKAETLHLYMHRQLLERVKIFPLYVSGGHSAPQCTCDPLIYWKLLELWSWI